MWDELDKVTRFYALVFCFTLPLWMLGMESAQGGIIAAALFLFPCWALTEGIKLLFFGTAASQEARRRKEAMERLMPRERP